MAYLSNLLELKNSRFQSGSSRRRKTQSNGKVTYENLEAKKLLATIAWQTGIISSAEDISTNGSLVFAINGSATTGTSSAVNGVNFVSSTRADSNTLSQLQSPGNESLSTTLGNDNNSSFSNGGTGSAFEPLIVGAWWGAASGDSASVTLNGLTIGDTYEIQLFSSDARGNRDDTFVTRVDNGDGGVGVDLSLNNQPFRGRPGDFGIGTFTADSSTQTFNLQGFIGSQIDSGRIQVNAIQLRVLDPVVLVPGAFPVLNEFSAVNNGVLDDDNGNSSDYIEIFNAGQDAINLAGYTLTDDPADPTKYTFPLTPLGGGDYLVVFAADDADPTAGTDLYTGFGLGSAGDYLGFFDPAGNLVTEFGTGGADFPAQFSNVTYGFVADDTFSVPSFLATPTPGAPNLDPVDGVIDSLPTVSVDRGFHEQAFDVDIVSQTAGAILVYTTDGSEPSLSNGVPVLPANADAFAQTTLNISSTTSLRTASVRVGFETLATTTHTYVFIDDVIQSDVLDTNITQDPRYSGLLRDGLLSIPTLSFNFEDEIEDRDTPEQRASVEWLAPDGSEGFQIDAGIRSFGGGFSDFDKQSFRLFFRSIYGESDLNFPIFEGIEDGAVPATDSFDQLNFRSGSQDQSGRGFYHSNRFVDDTLLDAGYVAPHGRFVHIYINGTYWGQYHMRERWNDDFLASYYGGSSDDYETVNGNINNGNNTPAGWSPGEINNGTGVGWETINSIVNDNSLSASERFQALSETVDLNNYLDFMLIWMAGRAENEFRAGGASDGSTPYTFFLNDADGWLRSSGDDTDNPGPGNILGTLVADADPEFLTLYADRIQNMFGEGGVLSPERAVERLQERVDEVQLSFLLESARWGERTPESYQNAVDNAINNLLPSIAGDMIARFQARGLFPTFEAPSFEVDGVTQNGGDISAGATLTFSADDTIYYTTDGSDPRLAGGAVNPNAIGFNSASNTTTLFSSGSTWRFEDSGSNLGTAWRNSNFDDSAWSLGASELGYGDGDEATVVDDGGDASNRNITTYFRKTINVPAGNFSSVNFDLIRDDGAVVYLNGVEIFRSNISADIPLGQVGYDVLAEGAIGNSAESTPVSFSIPPSLLLPGNNTFAVEIHQAAVTSSDISFDAELRVTSLTSGSQAVVLNTSTNILARTFVNGQWSAVRNEIFSIPVSQSDLRISEINYNPADPTAAEIAAGFIDNDDFEFIELFNPSTTGTINLSGVQLTNGVTFNFGDIDLLPGERVVVVEDIDAFMARYGDSATVLGQWSGALSNGGEEITLSDSSLNEIQSVNFGDNDPFPFAADGQGFTLVLADEVNTPVEELGKYYSYRASTELGGTPGAASAAPSGVVINEILAHTDAPQSDTIELFNPTGSAIDVSGYFLSDDSGDLQKYQIPSGTIISAGGYLVFDESDFNASATGFALSGSTGDQVFLSQGSGGQFIGLEDSVEFSATFNGESLGRLPDGEGRLTRLASNSFGSANGDAEVGPLVISEINYHPADPSAAALAIDPLLIDDDLEYIEIANPTSSAIDLTNWRLRGEADYDFVAGTSLAAGEAIIVVSFDPSDFLNAGKLAAFRAEYNISAEVTIVGGYTGSLSNSSGRISLQQPDTPDVLGVVPRVVVDEVVYDDLAPWGDADGSGLTLERDDLSANGNLASSWVAVSPTPGVFESDFLLGDASLDGVVDFGDIPAFIAVLQSGTFLDQADINRDGVVDFTDISFFVSLLQAQ